MTDAGIVPMTVVKDATAQLWTQLYDHVTVHEDVALRTDAATALAIRKGTPVFRGLVNDFVQHASHRHDVRQCRLQPAISVMRAACTTRRPRRTSRSSAPSCSTSRSTAPQYDMPWMLVAAQAYQESQFDQSRKSSVGAVGVMQIKPATAAGQERRDHRHPHEVERQHPRRHQVHALRDRTAISPTAPWTGSTRTLRAGRVQCRPRPGRQLRAKAKAAGARPQRLVRQRGDHRGPRDRPRNGRLREQHLQVLHGIQGRGRAAGRTREVAGRPPRGVGDEMSALEKYEQDDEPTKIGRHSVAAWGSSITSRSFGGA